MRNHCCDKKKNSRGSRGTQDQKLIDIVQVHGDQGNWESIPRAAGLLRCGKSHRLPWLNYLNPDVKQAPFKEDEADLIIKLHRLLGDRWSLIAGRLPGRTDNEIKNYWNSHLKKKIASLGTNPHNHWNSHLKKKLAGLGTNPHSHQVNQTRLDRKVGDHDKMRHEQSDGEVSDATSLCMDDHMKDKSASEQQLPDLNLDLTLSLPCDRDPTLLLLR